MIFKYLVEAMPLNRIVRIRKWNTEANVEINQFIFLTQIICPSLEEMEQFVYKLIKLFTKKPY